MAASSVVPLDRSSPMPLWAQLEADLRRRVDTGEFDERFPTDIDLTEQYDVSRHTVREAIRHLNSTGLLRRERGRGTVLNRPEFEQNLGSLYSLFQSIESAGVTQRSDVIELRTAHDPVAAEQLGLPDDAPLVYLERLRWAGDAPLAIDRAWLPNHVGRELLDADFSHTALYDELERTYGAPPDQGWERITPVVPTAAERRQLQLGELDAAFSIERLGRRGSEPIEWRVTLIRGDRYRFVAEWASSTQTELRLASIDHPEGPS